MSLLELFVDVDDFCQLFLPIWQKRLLGEGSKKRLREGQLSLSEIMTIIIYFHQSRYRNFKSYYLEHVCRHLRADRGERAENCHGRRIASTGAAARRKVVWALR